VIGTVSVHSNIGFLTGTFLHRILRLTPFKNKDDNSSITKLIWLLTDIGCNHGEIKKDSRANNSV
jgi:hypothetical protein